MNSPPNMHYVNEMKLSIFPGTNHGATIGTMETARHAATESN